MVDPVGYSQAGSPYSRGMAQSSSPSSVDVRKRDMGNGYYINQQLNSVTGQWEDVGQPIPKTTNPDGTLDTGNADGSITITESSSGVRIYNQSSGISEPGVKSSSGGWVPESTVADKPASSSNAAGKVVSAAYNPVQISVPVTDNYGSISTKKAWVLDYGTPVVYEPGATGYGLAVGPSGKKLDSWGGYDPTRSVFVVTTNTQPKPGVDTLGEVMANRADGPGLARDLEWLYGSLRALDLAKNTTASTTAPVASTVNTIAQRAANTDIGLVNKSLVKASIIPEGITEKAVDLYTSTFPGTVLTETVFPEKYVSTYPSGTDLGRPPANSTINPDKIGVLAGKLYVPSGNATIAEKLAVDQLNAAVGQQTLIIGFGLIGNAPSGLGRGVSLVDDVILKIPVVKDAYTKTAETIRPTMRSVSASLNKATMPTELRDVYSTSVKGSGIVIKTEPGVTPKIDVAASTRIPEDTARIIEEELGRAPNSLYGGAASGVQYKYTVPRLSRDVDAFVSNPADVAERINTRLGGDVASTVTDLHSFPPGYPIEGAMSGATVKVEYEEVDTGIMLGSRLFGDPIPKVPGPENVVVGNVNGLNYEKLGYLASRKFNAVFEDIAGVEGGVKSASDVSKLSNRLGKDALDLATHTRELAYAETARGGNIGDYEELMGDISRLYERNIKTRINGVERETTVGQLAREAAENNRYGVSTKITYELPEEYASTLTDTVEGARGLLEQYGATVESGEKITSIKFGDVYKAREGVKNYLRTVGLEQGIESGAILEDTGRIVSLKYGDESSVTTINTASELEILRGMKLGHTYETLHYHPSGNPVPSWRDFQSNLDLKYIYDKPIRETIVTEKGYGVYSGAERLLEPGVRSRVQMKIYDAVYKGSLDETIEKGGLIGRIMRKFSDAYIERYNSIYEGIIDVIDLNMLKENAVTHRGFLESTLIEKKIVEPEKIMISLSSSAKSITPIMSTSSMTRSTMGLSTYSITSMNNGKTTSIQYNEPSKSVYDITPSIYSRISYIPPPPEPSRISYIPPPPEPSRISYIPPPPEPSRISYIPPPPEPSLSGYPRMPIMPSLPGGMASYERWAKAGKAYRAKIGNPLEVDLGDVSVFKSSSSSTRSSKRRKPPVAKKSMSKKKIRENKNKNKNTKR